MRSRPGRSTGKGNRRMESQVCPTKVSPDDSGWGPLQTVLTMAGRGVGGGGCETKLGWPCTIWYNLESIGKTNFCNTICNRFLSYHVEFHARNNFHVSFTIIDFFCTSGLLILRSALRHAVWLIVLELERGTYSGAYHSYLPSPCSPAMRWKYSTILPNWSPIVPRYTPNTW